MRSTVRPIRLLVASLLVSTGVQAARLSLEPGLWEASWTIHNTLTGQAFTETRTQCIRTREFNPRELLRQAQGCTVTDEQQQGNRLHFTLVCTLEGGAKTEVTGDFATDGTRGNGQLHTKMRLGEITLTMNTQVATRRLGACPATQS